MIKVIKRNGDYVKWEDNKVINAISKTGLDINNTIFIVNCIKDEIKSDIVTVEKISDLIEVELMNAGHFYEAKAFIIYRHLHHKKRIPKCQQASMSFVPEYLFCDEFADKQAIDWEWTHLENDPSEDVANLITHCTQAQMHAVIFTSKILTTYEGELGERYWAGRFQKIFPRHEFRNLGLVFARMETQTHAKVYRKFNEALSIETTEFYRECLINPALKERMKFIDDAINSPNDLLSIASFTLLEGVSLFCIFAFYKNFQNNGNNLLPKFVSNINFSARDETHHAVAGSTCFKTLLEESFLSEVEKKLLNDDIINIAKQLRAHELLIIDEMFSKGELPGLSRWGLIGFLDARLNKILKTLEVDYLFQNENIDNVSTWFNKGIDSYIYNDTFAKGGREYTRKFTPEDFEDE